MTIGIDASRSLRAKRTGTEAYNAEIIKHLIKHDDKNTYRLYSSREATGDMAEVKAKNVTWRVMPFPRGWTLFRLSLEMLFRSPDVLFIPAHTLPLIPGKKSVVTIHDIGFDHSPEIYKWTDIVYHRFDVQYVKRFATHIITPSEFTRQDLHQKYDIPLKKMTVVHHGFDAKDYRPAQPNEKSPLDVPYFYFIGRLEYKKNISRILEAFAEFKRTTGLPHKLILAGSPAHGYESIRATYENLGDAKKDVEMLGYTPQDKALNYLRHAEALVFPTLFEGFGLPVLEAYASGTPVITSNTTCLPEIAGDAALLVTPTEVNQIAEAMAKIAHDKKLRSELIAKGEKRYKEFSWDKAALETLHVLEKVAKA